jgi:predicted phage terminase large subunit-like protein
MKEDLRRLPSNYQLEDPEFLARSNILVADSDTEWHRAKWEELLHYADEDPDKLSDAAKTELIYKRIRAGDFKLFVQVVSEQKFEFHTVHNVIAAFFLDLIFRRNTKSLLSLGPRHGKSELMCHLVSFLYGLNGGMNNSLYTSYGIDLSTIFGGKIRDHLSNPYFLELFPNAGLSQTSKAAKRFSTLAGGKFFASSVNAALTGMGAGVMEWTAFPGALIGDDLVKDMQSALSEKVMETTNQWVKSEMFTRGNMNHFKLITATRYSLMDVHETLLKGKLNIEDPNSPYVNEYHPERNPDGWRYLNIPTLCEDVDRDPLLRKEIDAAAWPTHFPAKDLISKRSDDEYTFSALYQGNPVPKKGSLWKRKYLNFLDSAPRLRYVYMSIDSSYGVQLDESVITVFGVPEDETDPNIYILDQIGSNEWEFPELSQTVVQMWKYYHAGMVVIESAASGKSLAQSLEAQYGMPIELVPATKSKPQRFSETLPPQREGRVILIRGDWNTKLVSQLTSFPFAAHDDRVDSFALGLWYWLTILKSGKIHIAQTQERLRYDELTELIYDLTSYDSAYESWGNIL